MALTSSQITELVRKAKIHLRIADNDPDFLVGGLGIFHDESSSATAATVAVSDSVLTLVITGGANAGTTNLDLTNASYDTLTEVVSSINTLDIGFVARLIGDSDTASTDIVPFGSTSVFGISNEKELEVESNALLELLVEEIYDSIVDECDRHFLDASYDELNTIYSDGVIVLREPDVSAVHFVSNETQAAMTVNYTGNDQHARVEVTDTTLKITSTAGNTDTSNEWTYSSGGSYDTVTELVDAVNAVSGWSSTLLKDGPSKYLTRRPALNVKRDGTSTQQDVDVWIPYNDDYTTHYEAGVIQLMGSREIGMSRCMYRAGTAVIPKPVEGILFSLMKQAYDSSRKSSAVKSERLGDYSYTLEDGAGHIEIGEAVRRRLSKYVREMP